MGKIPVGGEDWKFWSDEVTEKITMLHEEGKKIVIISNQGGVHIGLAKIADLQEKVDDIQKQINVPMLVMIITEKGHNRKPDVGSWEILEEHFNNKVPILKNKSFYAGMQQGEIHRKLLLRTLATAIGNMLEMLDLPSLPPNLCSEKEPKSVHQYLRARLNGMNLGNCKGPMSPYKITWGIKKTCWEWP